MRKACRFCSPPLILAVLVSIPGICGSQPEKKEYRVPIIPDEHYDEHVLRFGFAVRTPEDPDAVLEIPKDSETRVSYLVKHIGDRGLGRTLTPLGYELNAVSVELVRCGSQAGPEVHKAFSEALRKGDTKRAKLLVCVLGRLGYEESFDDVALMALEHSCTYSGDSAIWALPRIDRDRAVPVLIELLYPDPDIEDDQRTSRIPVTHALSKAVGKSFPAPFFHPGKPEPVAVWEDWAKWREWAQAQDPADMVPLSESVRSAVEERKERRLREE